MAASVGASKIPPKRTIDMAVIQKLCKEIADKIREEKLYPEDIIKTVERLKPSQWRRQGGGGGKGGSASPNELKDHPCEKMKSEEKLREGDDDYV